MNQAHANGLSSSVAYTSLVAVDFALNKSSESGGQCPCVIWIVVCCKQAIAISQLDQEYVSIM